MKDGTGHEGTAWDESPSWDEHFIDQARQVAKKSRDPSTKCGCVIVTADHEPLSNGYNGFPRGISYTNARLPRKEKYKLIVHAEANAILNAARLGHKLLGSTAYVTGPPCLACAGALIQAGVKAVVIPMNHNFLRRHEAGDWNEMEEAMAVLQEAQVRYVVVAGT